MSLLNLRNYILLALTCLVFSIKIFYDPTGQGTQTLELLLYISTPIIVVLLGHWLRKLLLPYIDLESLVKTASESPVGAGLVFFGVAYFVGQIYSLFGPAARALG